MRLSVRISIPYEQLPVAARNPLTIGNDLHAVVPVSRQPDREAQHDGRGWLDEGKRRGGERQPEDAERLDEVGRDELGGVVGRDGDDAQLRMNGSNEVVARRE